jgi:hypothetical protein
MPVLWSFEKKNVILGAGMYEDRHGRRWDEAADSFG